MEIASLIETTPLQHSKALKLIGKKIVMKLVNSNQTNFISRLCKSYRISMCKARCITHQGKVISATGMHNHAPHMNNKSQELPPGHSPNSLLTDFFSNTSSNSESSHAASSVVMPNFQFLQHPANQSQVPSMIQSMPSAQNSRATTTQLPSSQNDCNSAPTITFKHENL
jgi:hypothetical protein